jgi:DNA-binding CsgD family transcriptional regulator
MILGRSVERARLRGALAQARSGSSVALVVRGEAGIGKSALVQDVVAEAVEDDAGLVVLRATGVEAESEISFAGLSDLLRPAQHLLQEVPGPQAAALAGALALAPPAARDRFAVAAATLSLLAAAARDAPLCCVVDDAQWLDSASSEALVFAARRMQAEGSLILFVVRDGEPGADRFEGFDQLRLAGLDVAAATELLASASVDGGALPRRVAEQLVADTGGNPLALKELPRQLSADQIAGREPITTPLPVNSQLLNAFTRRIGDLPEPARAALRLASASDLDAIDVVVEALGDAGSPADLEPAEENGLIRLDGGRLVFVHPLIRSAVYHSATPAQRRAAHARLADAVLAVPTPQAGERRAWHLAAATLAADEPVAAELEEVGYAALTRHSYVAGLRILERSAGLSPLAPDRVRRLRIAALAALPAGRPADADRLLAEALEVADETTALQLEAELHRIRMWAGAPEAGRRRMTEFARRISGTAPRVAATAYLSAAQVSLGSYDTAAIVAATGEARRLTGGDPRLALHADLLDAFAAAQRLDPPRAAALLDARAEQLAAEDPLALDQLVTMAAAGYLAAERPASARPLLTGVIAAGREANAAGLLTLQLPWLATVELLEDNWSAALALAVEAVDLVRQTGWWGQLPSSLSTLAKVEAGIGLPDAAAHAREALAAAKDGGSPGATVHALIALGAVGLGAGRFTDAAGSLLEALSVATELDAPLLAVQVLPDLIEAEAAAREPEAAARHLGELTGLVARSRKGSALASAARCRGILAADGYRDAFAEALDLLGPDAPAYERGRTEMAFGIRLRQARDRSGAQEQLGAALARFDRIGAAPWAARAREELLAAGGRAAPGTDGVAHRLTPQELQVSLAVSSGRTNADVASALFLSVKTVEFHLSNVYRKLGVRSRTQLTRMLTQQPAV